MRAGAIAIATALILAGCGGGSDGGRTAAVSTAETAPAVSTTAGLPPGAVAPPDSAGADEGRGAEVASPESGAEGPSASGELPSDDQAAVRAAVSEYIAALNRHDAAGVCSLVPVGCHLLTRSPIGTRPPGGAPAWRRTSLHSVKVERLSDERARVSATVTHRFSDRKYVSVEDDVIYLEKRGGHWLLAKPSGTLYRAVGYREPPLRAFAPPSGW